MVAVAVGISVGVLEGTRLAVRVAVGIRNNSSAVIEQAESKATTTRNMSSFFIGVSNPFQVLHARRKGDRLIINPATSDLPALNICNDQLKYDPCFLVMIMAFHITPTHHVGI